jgi:hypothetical protein
MIAHVVVNPITIQSRSWWTWSQDDINMECKYFVKLKGEGWVHKTSLTPPLFIEVPVKSQKSELSCICVRGIDFVSFYNFSIGLWPCSYSVVCFVFLLDCGPVPTVWYFLFFYWIVALFLQCGMFYFSIGLWPVPTVWYFLFFYWIVALFLQSL